MSTIPHITLTSQGETMMRRSIDEGPMTFTRMAMGDGRPAGAIPGLTAMGRERLTVPITKSDRAGNTLTLFGEVTGVSVAFSWRELGLFARIAGEGEQLVGYLNLGDTGEVVAPDDGVERAIYVTLAVLDGAEISVTLGPREHIDWEQINDPPETYQPSQHTHPWEQITNPPETYQPSQHTHPWEQITNPPATFLTGHGAPGGDTAAPVGMRYLDLDNNAQYVCVSHDAGGYHWSPPYLLGSGGQVGGDLSVGGVFSAKGDYLVVGPDRVTVNRRLMGKDMTLSGEANVDGPLTVGKTAEILSDVTVGRPDEEAGPKGNLRVYGSAALHKATVDSNMDVTGHLSVGSTATFGGELVPAVAENSNVGDEGKRFRTAFFKKFEASEHVATPKLRPPTGLDHIKFMCEADNPPGASPNPLPLEWGGTGRTDGGWINPNLLCNWYFANPINQRGKTEYSLNGYSIDRWKTGHLSQLGTIKIEDGCITIEHGNTGYTDFTQKFEHNIPDGPVTLSVLTKSGELHAVTLTIPELNPRQLTTGVSVYSTSKTSIGLRVNASASISIVAAKLELGDQQTLAHQENGVWVLNEIPDPALELAKCQRYYLRLTGDASAVAKNVILARQNATAVEFLIPTPVPMRANPTFHIQGDVTLPIDATLDARGSAVAGENGVYFRVEDPSGDAEYADRLYPAALQFASDFLELDAEL